MVKELSDNLTTSTQGASQEVTERLSALSDALGQMAGQIDTSGENMREGVGQALADLKVGLNDIADALKAGGRAASDEMAKAVTELNASSLANAKLIEDIVAKIATESDTATKNTAEAISEVGGAARDVIGNAVTELNTSSLANAKLIEKRSPRLIQLVRPTS